MRKVPIDKFFISSDFREEQEDIGELALSIKEMGLVHSIAVQEVDGRFDIIAGRRRFRALRDYLKLDHLIEGEHFVVKEGIDALVCQLVENINRLNFKPIEVARAVRAIHDKGVEEHGKPVRGHKGGWSLDDTARVIGRDKSFVSRLLKISDNEEVVEDCTSLKDALTLIDRKDKKDLLSIVRKAKVKKASITAFTDTLQNYKCMDARDYVKALPLRSIDLIYTDPPFGIDLDEITEDSYEDDIEKLMEILKVIIPEFARILRQDKYAIVWTSFDLFSTVRGMMEDAGFTTSYTPILWMKMGATGRSMQADNYLGCAAECAVYGYLGAGAELSIKGRSNIFAHPIIRSERIHVAQKPEALTEDIIQIFSSKGDTVVDIFAGSLSTLRACISTERNFMGCELNKDFYTRGISYTMDWLNDKTNISKQVVEEQLA